MQARVELVFFASKDPLEAELFVHLAVTLISLYLSGDFSLQCAWDQPSSYNKERVCCDVQTKTGRISKSGDQKGTCIF